MRNFCKTPYVERDESLEIERKDWSWNSSFSILNWTMTMSGNNVKKDYIIIKIDSTWEIEKASEEEEE